MTEWLLSLVPQYGAWLLAIATFLSCLAIPIPVSILMLAAGGFIAAAELDARTCGLAALTGAVVGDQTGYLAGRYYASAVLERLEAKGAPIARAIAMLERHDRAALFFSRWLFSALGPYINLAAGSAKTPWRRFSVWAIAGEIVWVSLYIGVGYVFTGNLQAASELIINLLGFIATAVLALGLGAWLFTNARA